MSEQPIRQNNVTNIEHDYRSVQHGKSSVSFFVRWEWWTSKLVFLSLVLLATVVLLNALQAYQQVQRMSALRCDRPVFDFGRAFVGDVVEHTFRVANVGRTSLTIKKVVTECGCTSIAGDLEGLVIAPQQSFDVPLKFTLPDSADNKTEKKVILQFSREPVLEMTLKIRGSVVRRWSWSPSGIVFDGVPANQEASRTISIMQQSGSPLSRIELVNPTGHLIRAKVEENVVPGTQESSSWTVTVTTVPPLPRGRQQAALYLHTSDSRSPIGPIPVTLLVAE